MGIKFYQYIFLCFLGLILFVYLFVLLYFFLHQRRLVFSPVRAKPIKTPKIIGLDYEDVWISINGDEGIVHGWFIPSKYDCPYVLLVCHGNTGNLGDRIDFISVIYELGLNILIFDYRGYGESSPGISEKTTYEDATAVFDYLVRRGFSEDKIIVLGRSLGGGVACELALRRPLLAALILDSTFISIDYIAKQRYPLFPISIMLRIHYNNLDKIPNVQCPILLIHSKEDEVIPFFHAKRLAQVAHKEKLSFVPLTAGAHNRLFLDNREEYLLSIKSFLENAVGIKLMISE